MKKRLIETAILMVYVIMLAASVSGREIAVGNTNVTDTMAAVDSETTEGTELPAVAEKTTIEEAQWIYGKVKEIDFTVRQHPIDTSVYDEELDLEYKEAFYRMLTNQVPLGDNKYFADYFRDMQHGRFTEADFIGWLPRADYWYIDYDGDGLPELVVQPWDEGIYVFKYDPDEKRVDIISSAHMAWHLLGAGQLYYNDQKSYEYEYGYYQEDANGDWQRVYFDDIFDAAYLWEFRGYEEDLGPVYYIGYEGPDTDGHVAEFQVPRKMWDELTEGYFDALEEMPKALSYKDIFGDIEKEMEEETIDEEEILDLYEKFLAGEINARDVSWDVSIDMIRKAGIFAGGPDTSSTNIEDTRYAFRDVTGDGVPELHIQTEDAYYILHYHFGILFVWWVEEYHASEWTDMERGHGTEENERLTADQAAEYLLEYIYPGIDAYWFCTIYYEENDEAMDTVYHTTRYPDYEFDYWYYGTYTRQQLYCEGEVGEYLIFDLLSWNFFQDSYGELTPSHANYIQTYAIHRRTREIIEERIKYAGMWEYNDAFLELIGQNRRNIVTRELYDYFEDDAAPVSETELESRIEQAYQTYEDYIAGTLVQITLIWRN